MMQMNLYARQEQRHRHREWTCGHRRWGGEGGMNREIRVDIYTPSHVKEIASESL